jgi:hypothetical protein
MDLVFLIHRGEEGGYWAESVGHGILRRVMTLMSCDL